jgi:hypothetical protein
MEVCLFSFIWGDGARRYSCSSVHATETASPVISSPARLLAESFVHPRPCDPPADDGTSTKILQSAGNCERWALYPSALSHILGRASPAAIAAFVRTHAPLAPRFLSFLTLDSRNAQVVVLYASVTGDPVARADQDALEQLFFGATQKKTHARFEWQTLAHVSYVCHESGKYRVGFPVGPE